MSSQIMDIIALGVIILCAAGMFAFFIWLVIFAGLSDEQRYGIDEHGNAKTPEYLEKKRQHQIFVDIVMNSSNDCGGSNFQSAGKPFTGNSATHDPYNQDD